MSSQPGSLTDTELQKLYAWIDTIPLSRPKKNISRDFSDGCLVAEVVGYYFPRLVEVHNYSPANGAQQKLYNWNTLNQKVLRKLKCQLVPPALEDIIQCKPGAIENFLHNLQSKMAKFKASQSRSTDSGYSHNISHEAVHSEDDYSPRVPTARPSNFYPQQLMSGSPAGKGPPGEQSHHGRGAAMASHGDSAERQKKNVSIGERDRRRPQDLPGPTQAGRDALQREVDQEILVEKEETIQELRETVEILEMKQGKLEQLVRLKDAKIQRLNEELVRLTSSKGTKTN